MFPPEYIDKATDARSLVWIMAAAMGVNPYLLEIFQYEIDKHATYYGAHNRYPYERPGLESEIAAQAKTKRAVLIEIMTAIDSCADFQDKCYPSINGPFMFCGATYNWGEQLRQRGVPVLPSPWQPPITDGAGEYLVYEMCAALSELCKSSLAIFTDREFLLLCEKCLAVLKCVFDKSQVRGIIVPYTTPPLERFSVDYFRSIGKPTFLALHADVGNMSNCVNQQERPVDYYVVFGDEQKVLFEAAGVPASRLITTGHPLYPVITPKPLTFSLERPLVIGWSWAGAAMGSAPLYSSRSLLIEYLYRVQKVLKRLGVSSARFRCHPSESHEWYASVVDSTFYTVENTSLQEAFERSSILLGGPSTIVYEAPIYGINYSVLFPSEQNGCGYWVNTTDSPWNGKDPRIPFAMNDEDFYRNLVEKRVVDMSLITGRFGTNFDPSQFVDRIMSYLNTPSVVLMVRQNKEIGTEFVQNFWAHVAALVVSFEASRVIFEDDDTTSLYRKLSQHTGPFPSRLVYLPNSPEAKGSPVSSLLVKKVGGDTLGETLEREGNTLSADYDAAILVFEGQAKGFPRSFHVPPALTTAGIVIQNVLSGGDGSPTAIVLRRLAPIV